VRLLRAPEIASRQSSKKRSQKQLVVQAILVAAKADPAVLKNAA